jgi:hypothetical protein
MAAAKHHPAWKTKMSNAELWEYYRKGMSTCQLGMLCKCTASNIRNRLLTAGYVLRKRNGRQPL